MRKTVSIFCLWLATLSVLSVTVMLHHHHLREVCFVMAECEADGTLNDSHTGHHPAAGADTPSDSCEVENTKTFIVSSSSVSRPTHGQKKADRASVAWTNGASVATMGRTGRTALIPMRQQAIATGVLMSTGGLRAPPCV